MTSRSRHRKSPKFPERGEPLVFVGELKSDGFADFFVPRFIMHDSVMTEDASNNSTITDLETTEKLTAGLLEIFYPKLKLVKSQLCELTKKQNQLYNELHMENLKFSHAQYFTDMHDMLKKIKYYREKLLVIKQNMLLLHEQSTKLKKKALKLVQQKQKEALVKVHQRENEELLIGKPNSSIQSE